MNTYHRAMDGAKVHIWTDFSHHGALCGLFFYVDTSIELSEAEAMEQAGDLCKTCVRTAGARDIALWNQTADETRTLKGQQIHVSGGVREIPAKVFRVSGTSDTYTVTVPLESGLAVTCDCRDGKIHPEKFCKHASAVLLSMQRGAA